VKPRRLNMREFSRFGDNSRPKRRRRSRVRVRYGGEATAESGGKRAKTAGREGKDLKKDSGSSFGSNGAENRSLMSPTG